MQMIKSQHYVSNSWQFYFVSYLVVNQFRIDPILSEFNFLPICKLRLSST